VKSGASVPFTLIAAMDRYNHRVQVPAAVPRKAGSAPQPVWRIWIKENPLTSAWNRNKVIQQKSPQLSHYTDYVVWDLKQIPQKSSIFLGENIMQTYRLVEE
jgi:hypothetical protein